MIHMIISVCVFVCVCVGGAPQDMYDKTKPIEFHYWFVVPLLYIEMRNKIPTLISDADSRKFSVDQGIQVKISNPYMTTCHYVFHCCSDMNQLYLLKKTI